MSALGTGKIMQENRMDFCEKANTVCLLKSLFGDLMDALKHNCLANRYYFLYALVKSWNNQKMNLYEIANTVCLIKSLLNDQILPTSTQ